MKNVVPTIIALALMAPVFILGLYPSYLLFTGAMTPEAFLLAFAKAWQEDFWSNLGVAIIMTFALLAYVVIDAKRQISAKDASAKQRI